jgi:hypothetical protein
MRKVKDQEDIKMIVKQVLTAMYGNDIDDLRFRIIERFTMKPYVWDVAVDFRYDNQDITVDLEVDELTGRVPYAREIIRW